VYLLLPRKDKWSIAVFIGRKLKNYIYIYISKDAKRTNQFPKKNKVYEQSHSTIYLADFVPPRRSVLLDVDNYHFFHFTSPFPTLHKHPEVAAFLPLDTWLHVSVQPRSSVNLTHWYYYRILSQEITGFHKADGKWLPPKCDTINDSIRTRRFHINIFCWYCTLHRKIYFIRCIVLSFVSENNIYGICQKLNKSRFHPIFTLILHVLS